MLRLPVFVLVIAASLVSGCEWIRPYHVDIRQGTVVTGDMVARLKPGMTREQVRLALGSPLLVDPFHGERWDYPNEFRGGRSSKADRKLFSVYFKDDKLDRWEGDVKPEVRDEQASNRVIEIAPKP
ncbi:outer membrane protein assembly factor BamE [Niveibacterium sp. SC-1]|uniref:outer membrane protein assembly factor BamE n=1 Tax=Niveibacterium sp. SC-1 TaxID=3135646 RepID=UPI00311FC4E5